jgi:hypothetical protein
MESTYTLTWPDPELGDALTEQVKNPTFNPGGALTVQLLHNNAHLTLSSRIGFMLLENKEEDNAGSN